MSQPDRANYSSGTRWSLSGVDRARRGPCSADKLAADEPRMSGARGSHVPTDRSSIDALLEEGLDLYGQNRVPEAVRCWHRALALEPGEARALEYLECAGASPAPPSGHGVVIALHTARTARAGGEPPSTSFPLSDGDAPGVDRPALERLLAERRYEDALLLLYRERSKTPEDPAITRGIRMLKEHLTVRFARELGSLDRIPVLLAGSEQLARATAEQRQVLRLIDGLATLGDVLQSSRLGRFETYRLLATMLQRGVISTRAPSIFMPAVRPPERAPSQRPPPPSEPPSTHKSPSSSPISAEPTTTPRASVPPHSGLLATEPATDEYELLFSHATEAYLSGDHGSAMALYEQCHSQRPDDGRVRNNLERLRMRKRG